MRSGVFAAIVAFAETGAHPGEGSVIHVLPRRARLADETNVCQISHGKHYGHITCGTYDNLLVRN